VNLFPDKYNKAAGIKNVIAPAFDSIYGITELHYEATIG
jgi:hypothetical protein